jgi:hypothetical protein
MTKLDDISEENNNQQLNGINNEKSKADKVTLKIAEKIKNRVSLNNDSSFSNQEQFEKHNDQDDNLFEDEAIDEIDREIDAINDRSERLKRLERKILILKLTRQTINEINERSKLIENEENTSNKKLDQINNEYKFLLNQFKQNVRDDQNYVDLQFAKSDLIKTHIADLESILLHKSLNTPSGNILDIQEESRVLDTVLKTDNDRFDILKKESEQLSKDEKDSFDMMQSTEKDFNRIKSLLRDSRQNRISRHVSSTLGNLACLAAAIFSDGADGTKTAISGLVDGVSGQIIQGKEIEAKIKALEKRKKHLKKNKENAKKRYQDRIARRDLNDKELNEITIRIGLIKERKYCLTSNVDEIKEIINKHKLNQESELSEFEKRKIDLEKKLSELEDLGESVNQKKTKKSKERKEKKTKDSKKDVSSIADDKSTKSKLKKKNNITNEEETNSILTEKSSNQN